MAHAVPTIDEVLVAASLAEVTVTTAQAQAIIDTIGRIESSEGRCIGLKSWHIAGGRDAHAYWPLLAADDAFVEVHFHYLTDQIETAPLGLEVTLFNPDGSVRYSQDYG